MNSYEILCPASITLETLASEEALPVFSPAALHFAEALSQQLVSRQDIRRFPELVALGFWLRKANIKRIVDSQLKKHTQTTTVLVPRGIIFHIAPSNVDSIFIYSWMLALLSGNKNIVRLSSRLSEQTNLLITIISGLFNQAEHAEIASRTMLVRYTADDATTAFFSAACDVRVIWGGDKTVSSIRRIAIPPSAVELTFPNKYSLALIRASYWLSLDPATQKKVIQAFFNDAYWFDQMACSSPRMILWEGNNNDIQQARQSFWQQLHGKLVDEKIRMDDADYVNKLYASHAIAIETNTLIEKEADNLLAHLWLEDPALFVQHHCGAGLFIESGISELEEMRPLLSRTIQTISYLGFERSDFTAFLQRSPVRGIDRIVPFGKALDFSPVWDGFDLINSFCREIVID